jgi:murein L,D-transpeptidase YcbB/YkuD
MHHAGLRAWRNSRLRALDDSNQVALLKTVIIGKAYIAEKNFEVVTPDGKVTTDGVISDAVLAQLKSGRLRVRQKPGPTNSLETTSMATTSRWMRR